jgi:hypothetical protein
MNLCAETMSAICDDCLLVPPRLLDSVVDNTTHQDDRTGKATIRFGDQVPCTQQSVERRERKC